MDNALDKAVREVIARRDAQLSERITVAAPRLHALRGAVARAEGAPRAQSNVEWSRVIRECIASITAPLARNVGMRAAAACVLLIVGGFVGVGWFRDGSQTAPNASSASTSDRSRLVDSAVDRTTDQTPLASLEFERSALRGTALSLRVGAAELAQLQSGLLARRSTSHSDFFDHLTLAGFDLGAGVLLDAYPTTSNP